MIFVKKLKRPNKHSGYSLAPNKSTKARGLVITNTNSYPVYIDKMAPNKAKRHKKAAKKKVA